MSTATDNSTRKQLDELEDLLQRMLSLPVNPAEAAAPPPRPSAPAGGIYPGSFTITADTVPPTQPPATGTPPPQPRQIAPAARPTPPPAQAAQPMPPVRRLDPTPGDPTWSVPLPAASNPPPAIMNNWPTGIEATAAAMRQSPQIRPPVAVTPPAVVAPRAIPQAMEQHPMNEMPNPFANLRVEPIPAPSPMTPGAYPTSASGPADRLPVGQWPAVAIDWLCGNIFAMLGPPGYWLGQGRGKPIVGWLGWFMLAGAITWGVVDYLGMSW